LSLLALSSAAALSLASCGGGGGDGQVVTTPGTTTGGGGASAAVLAQGQQTFRSDTFGDETFFTDVLRLNEPVEAAVSPKVALSVGLKVDSTALPASVVSGIQKGTISLDDPQTTLALLQLNAVVGLKGQVETVNGQLHLVRLGVTCAICHSTVDDSFTKGIGKRLDGWPNRDLNVGAIIALSPLLQDPSLASVKAAYQSWGPGKYDARFNIVNGNTPLHGDGISKPSVIPPAYGLQNVNKITFTGDGDNIAYWNRYVAVTQFGGHGHFSDPRVPDAANVTNGNGDDLVSAKLPALQAYQLSLQPPAPPAGSFDSFAAVRGFALFNGKARCSTCHTGPTFTDANVTLHPQSDSVSLDTTPPTHADRSATKLYRTTPLRGVWQHPPYLHDGSAATLDVVVARYNTKMSLGLSASEQADVVQYLKSL
jgi:mono/diheme cytochrome c family protein